MIDETRKEAVFYFGKGTSMIYNEIERLEDLNKFGVKVNIEGRERRRWATVLDAWSI